MEWHRNPSSSPNELLQVDVWAMGVIMYGLVSGFLVSLKENGTKREGEICFTIENGREIFLEREDVDVCI